MRIWQTQEAKAKLTRLMQDARLEPQFISRRGVPEIVAMSIQRYDELINNKSSLVTVMKNSPLNALDLEFERDKSGEREVDLYPSQIKTIARRTTVETRCNPLVREKRRSGSSTTPELDLRWVYNVLTRYKW